MDGPRRPRAQDLFGYAPGEGAHKGSVGVGVCETTAGNEGGWGSPSEGKADEVRSLHRAAALRDAVVLAVLIGRGLR